jgi:hypothetical protein
MPPELSKIHGTYALLIRYQENSAVGSATFNFLGSDLGKFVQIAVLVGRKVEPELFFLGSKAGLVHVEISWAI